MVRHQPHLLVDLPEHGAAVDIDPDARRHLEKVLRIRGATPVTYTDGHGAFGVGVYEGGVIVRGDEEQRPRRHKLAVAVAPPHDNSRLRFLVEKLAELGVAKLVWIAAAHREGRAPRPDKVSGWVRGALEQSRGSWLMEVAGPLPVANVDEVGIPVFAQQGGGAVSDLPPIVDPVLCVGPEGGFAAEEIPSDAICVDLGDNILRMETAAIIGAALLLNAPNPR